MFVLYCDNKFSIFEVKKLEKKKKNISIINKITIRKEKKTTLYWLMTYYMIFNNATRELQIIREKNNKQQSTDKFNNKEKTQKKPKELEKHVYQPPITNIKKKNNEKTGLTNLHYK